jgi:RNA polymerase sigma factor (sigma-70 family)
LVEDTLHVEDHNNDKERAIVELKKIIKQLSPREREIVYLKYFQQFNNKEIAKLLDIKYQTVRNILANAIIKLRILGDDIVQLLFLVFK